MRAVPLVALVLAAPLEGPAGAQSERSASSLVVDVPQDDLYHNTACPLVRAAGSKVKIMRRGDAVRRKLKPHDCPVPEGEEALDPNSVTVYVQKDDNRYHKEGCSKLSDGATRTTLEEAGQKLWPCGVCKPPRRKPAAKVTE